MSKPLNNLSTSFTTGIEVRVDRLERTHNSLEARLINLTTLIRSHYNKIDVPGQGFNLEEVMKRIENLERKCEGFDRIGEIERRLQRVEENPAGEFSKALERTHAKIKKCMGELKETMKGKEKEFSDRISNEIRNFKRGFEIYSKKTHEPQMIVRKKSDEIENIIKDLQERIDKRESTPVRDRAGSFSVLRNNSCKSSLGQKQLNKKPKSKKLKKVKFN